MLIHNILNTHYNKSKKPNILCSHTDNRDFTKLLTKIVGSDNLSGLDNSIFAHKPINLVICNNRLEALDRCISLCMYFHCPLLVVDHFINTNKANENSIQIPNVTHLLIAINNAVANSWNIDHYHAICDTDPSNNTSIENWSQIITTLCLQPLKEIKRINEKKLSAYNQR